MAVPAADFPDPLDAPATPVGDADDLISRLADEAIDRMIAEDESADAHRENASAFAFPADTVGAAHGGSPNPVENSPGAVTPTGADLSTDATTTFNLRRAIDPPATPVVPPDEPFAMTNPPPEIVPSIPAASTPIESRSADADAASMTGGIDRAPSVSMTSEDVPASHHSTASTETPGPHDVERAASLPGTVAATASAKAESPPAPPADVRALLAETPAAGLPLFLRPLEWLNAPFAVLPEPMLGVLGQIGILTLLNAAAVLVYVLVFRRG